MTISYKFKKLIKKSCFIFDDDCEKIWLFYRKKIITVDDVLKLSLGEIFEKRRKITQDKWNKRLLERAMRPYKEVKNKQDKRKM